MAKSKIRGAKELEQFLKEAGPKIAGRLGDKAVMAGMRVIARAAKRVVAVRTGELKKSIAVVRRKRPMKASQRVAMLGFKPHASRRAHLLEFGTAHSAPQPFVRPAIDEKSEDALRAMEKTLANGIAKEEYKRATAAGADFEDI